jgi:putative ABC transport system permease protein
VIPFRREAVTINGKPTRFSTGDLAAIQNAADIKVAEGSLSALKPGTIALVKGGAKRPLGSTVTVSTNDGATRKLKVVALLDSSIDSSQLGALVDRATFDDYVGATAPTVAFVDAEEGEQTDTKKAINKLADARPDITVVEGNALGRLIGTVFDFLIKAVDGLLLMSVVVALIGIINTLSLSILERRRELGLLRVVGMTDNRVQRMVRLESLVIAGLGTIVGLAVGLFAAWALILSISRLTDADISPGLPIGELALILALGVVLGLVASLIPSRRSTRLDVLEALEAT